MRSVILLVVAALMVFGAHVLIHRAMHREALIAGGALVAFGLPLMIVSRRQLGSAFAVTPQAKELVMKGLYAKIPHPMYVFLDLTLLGVILLLRVEWLPVLWVILVALQSWQARRESHVLEGKFGDAYRAYRRQTWW